MMGGETNEGVPTWKLQRELKRIHREHDEDDRVEDEDLEALRAYDPEEWDSLDEFIEYRLDF